MTAVTELGIRDGENRYRLHHYRFVEKWSDPPPSGILEYQVTMINAWLTGGITKKQFDKLYVSKLKELLHMGRMDSFEEFKISVAESLSSCCLGEPPAFRIRAVQIQGFKHKPRNKRRKK